MIDDFNSRPETSKFPLAFTTINKLTDNFQKYFLVPGARKGMKFLATKGERDAFYATVNNFSLVDSAFIVAGNDPLSNLKPRLDEDSQLLRGFLAKWTAAPNLPSWYPCDYKISQGERNDLEERIAIIRRSLKVRQEKKPLSNII